MPPAPRPLPPGPAPARPDSRLHQQMPPGVTLRTVPQPRTVGAWTRHMRWVVASAGGAPSNVAAFDGATAASPTPLRVPMCHLDLIFSHDARHISLIHVYSFLFLGNHKRSRPGAQARAPRRGCRGRGRCACPAGRSGCCPMSTPRRPSPPPCGARPPPLTAPPVQHTQSVKLRSLDKVKACKHMQERPQSGTTD